MPGIARVGVPQDLLTAATYGVDEFFFVYGDRPEAGARSDDLTGRSMLDEVRRFSDGPGGIHGRCLQPEALSSVRVEETRRHAVWTAGAADVHSIGRLLHDFNQEFDEPTPSPSALAERFERLLGGGDTLVLLGGEGPDGVAVLRFRLSIWSDGLECYLAELYVVPGLRRLGLGRALMAAALSEARVRGADTMDIGVDEPDAAARRLYESLGFSNRVGGAAGPVMYVYERDLRGESPPPGSPRCR